MKILIVTMHRGNNYGSALQTYALSEYLCAKLPGSRIDVLDYVPQRVDFVWNMTVLFHQFVCRRKLRSKYDALRGMAILCSNKCVYDAFFRKHISLTHAFRSMNEIHKTLPMDYDVYMTGSDQVWNSTHNRGIDHVFFLDFAPKKSRLVAYAASFGKGELDLIERDETKHLLSAYTAISVRERSGIDILKSLGLNGEHVLDPTLLLTKDEWLKRIPHVKDDHYVLIYSVEPNKPELIKIARRIAERRRLKVFLVEWGFKKPSGVDKMISGVSPLELMAYFAHADFVVASSFHGTAFSVNFNKPFVSIVPVRFGDRAKSLLSAVGLEDHFIETIDFDPDRDLQPIEWALVNEKLDKERERSFDFLRKALQ